MIAGWSTKQKERGVSMNRMLGLVFFISLFVCPLVHAEPDLQRVYFKTISDDYGYTKFSWKAKIYCDKPCKCFLTIKLMDAQGFEQDKIIEAVKLVDGYQTLTGSKRVKTEIWKRIKDYKGSFLCP